MEDSFYLFGGWIGEPDVTTNVIAAFDTTKKQWNKVGELNQARRGHGVIIQEGSFVVVGGLGKVGETERCSFHNESIECQIVGPNLRDYSDFPEMMKVPENFCPK